MIETDALVVGCGPVALFLAFQLGLHGIRAQMVDVQDEPGGQCIALYPDKPIYDIPTVPVCTGRELIQNLLRQVAPFAPGVYLGLQVCTLACQADGRWLVTTCQLASSALVRPPPPQFLARTLFIAAGAGAFIPRELPIPGLSGFVGRQVFYHAQVSSLSLANQNVVLSGGSDDAVASAITLAQSSTCRPTSITLVYRRDQLPASPDGLSHFNDLRSAGLVRFVAGQILAIQTNTTGDTLTGLVVSTPAEPSLHLPVDALLVYAGLSPRLGPVAQWGLKLQSKQLDVDRETFATSADGIFAVGDVVTYPGKQKLIVCGFFEATQAAAAAAARLWPEQPSALPYTSSSTLLQRRLGVGTG